MNDDALYDEVAKELQAKAMVPGVWTRAFAEAGGELDRARALYIKYRVGQLAQIRSQQQEEERRGALEQTKQRKLSGFKRLTYTFSAFVSGLLTLGFALGGIAALVERSEGGVGTAFVHFAIAVFLSSATYSFYKSGRQ